MYERTLKPLRETARSEPLDERARRMYDTPPEIPQAVVDDLAPDCFDFLTEAFVPVPPAPAPSVLYTLLGETYFLNGRVSDLTTEQKNGVLRCLNLPNGIRMMNVEIDSVNELAILELHFFNINFLKEIVDKYTADKNSAKYIFPISGGVRLRAGDALGQVQVDSSATLSQPAIEMPDEDKPVLKLIVQPIGDYSTYTLELHSSGLNDAIFDPLFSEIGFKFRPGCFNTNCAPEWEIAPPPLEEPDIDYLAKDYDSFRLTMIAAMMKRVPGWQATSEADLDMVLAELFSAAADELSDYQDRVMNETYLSSARKRVSIARHARLMDYHIHQGNQASTWLAIEIEHDQGILKQFELNKNLKVWTGESKLDGVNKTDSENSVVFISKNEEAQIVHQLLNSIGLYTWEDSIPVLKAGSTRADLKLFDKLYADDDDVEKATDETSAKAVRDLIIDGEIKYLLIQEHLNPANGIFTGRDPSKRQLLKLKKDAAALRDPITNEWFVRVNWEKTDALRRDYCFTVDCPADSNGTAIGKVENVSLFHGNLVEVFHGRREISIFKEKLEKSENLVFLPDTPLEFYYKKTRWGTICRLPETALAYQITPSGGDVPPVSTLIVEVEEAGGGKDFWDEVPSLIHSDDSDENGDHFVVETDENRRSLIRFGNGINGKELSENAIVRCEYQYGEPLEGNIGADMLVNFELATIDAMPNTLQIRSIWNPFDVTNGRDIEPVMEIIRRVPEAFRSRQLRAVTLADYVARAQEIEGVSRAAAKYGWTGSWRTVRLTIDPLGTNELADELRVRVENYLDAVRLIGEDIEIRPPKFVPLEIKIGVCVLPDVWREDVSFVLEQEFSTGWTPDGRAGFFHPDRWTFGQPLFESQIIARIMQVVGIDHVISVNIKRWSEATPGGKFFTKLRHNEIIEVLNDPDHQERGFIEFEVKGGRQ